ncbi:MAG: family 43 glycosylhydrolase [Burkholderiales bacterium]|nr:family 43 glycosylhydrolase [Phycisphaerae bacterium]
MRGCGLLMIGCIVAGLGLSAEAQEPRRAFTPGQVWAATDGEHINAHGGGIIYRDGTYYWYGENRAARTPGGPRVASPGVQCYSSTDLFNWKNEGVVMKVIEDNPNHDITRGCNIERPKVVFNQKTKKYVMWFHLELRGQGYSAARSGLATADSPTGPFTFVRSLRPNAGIWSIEFPESSRTPVTAAEAKELLQGQNFRPGLAAGVYARRDFAGGQMARDMTLYVDDDGKGYLVASAEENYTLNIHELTDDYLDFTGKWTRVAPGGHNEAPAILKHNGKYHMLASGCTGWAPNPARVLQADSIWGPWKNVGNPCAGTNPQNNLGPEKTFGGQSTCIFQVAGKPGAYIAMFDEWRPRDLRNSGHIWLPVKFDGDRMVIDWTDKWDLSVFDK